MQKPKNQKELLDTIWLLLVGAEKNSLISKVDKIFKLIDDFIHDKENIRADSCPYKLEIQNLRSEINSHIEKHSEIKDTRYKTRGQVLVIIGIFITIVLGVLGLLLK